VLLEVLLEERQEHREGTSTAQKRIAKIQKETKPSYYETKGTMAVRSKKSKQHLKGISPTVTTRAGTRSGRTGLPPTRRTHEEELQAVAERGAHAARDQDSEVVEKTPTPITPKAGKLANPASALAGRDEDSGVVEKTPTPITPKAGKLANPASALAGRDEDSGVVEKTPTPISPMAGKLGKPATMTSPPARGPAKHATTAAANLAAKLLDDNADAENSLSPSLSNGKDENGDDDDDDDEDDNYNFDEKENDDCT
jgi:hypothetical protein